MNRDNRVSGSFRDPCGFLFFREGQLFRQVNTIYKDSYDLFMDSGLYQGLVKSGRLIPHIETEVAPADPESCYKMIKPEFLEFISYPYEWSFSQLKDAALLTLAIQRKSLDFGMGLKDASAYNIQFKDGNPIFIDTLSFEKLKPGEPWVGYRQFCQHFLAPLALMSKTDIRLSKLLRTFIDGIPLDLASQLLPTGTRLNMRLFAHLHLHAKSQKQHSGSPAKKPKGGMSKLALIGLIESLIKTVENLKWRGTATEWGNYYQDTNYSDTSFEKKHNQVRDYLQKAPHGMVWDLGANNGEFSRLASEMGRQTIAFDIDPVAVEHCYLRIKENKETNLLPLIMDLTNPSPGIGWENAERDSFIHRSKPTTVMALALIHHLAISNNLPLYRIGNFLANLAPWLIIEFVPKSDSQVQRLLASREDIFPDYTEDGFQESFKYYYNLIESQRVSGTERTLYLLQRRDS